MVDFVNDVGLSPWQQAFVSNLLSQNKAKSLLVAPIGTGKMMTALFAVRKMLEQRVVDALLVITDRIALRDQWQHRASRYGIGLEKSLKQYLQGQGVSATLQSLRTKEVEADIDEAAGARRWLIIAYDPGCEAKSLNAFVDRMLSINRESRALFIARDIPDDPSFESTFRFDAEFIFDHSILEAPSTEIRVARFAPSFSLLRRLQRSTDSIDSLSWREFEKLIATLLEQDGYVVELMSGSKDGGVDVIAVKDLGSSGLFKTLWQAKKHSLNNKVGISVIRELADTRQEFGASKGIVVTSSYLTRGALQRIERDKYILGKIDREDLDSWISKTLFGGSFGR